jgi:hypothetical protein
VSGNPHPSQGPAVGVYTIIERLEQWNLSAFKLSQNNNHIAHHESKKEYRCKQENRGLARTRDARRGGCRGQRTSEPKRVSVASATPGPVASLNSVIDATHPLPPLSLLPSASMLASSSRAALRRAVCTKSPSWTICQGMHQYYHHNIQ